MNENGTTDAPKRHTIWKDVADQLSDHIELASLELSYESDRVATKLLAVGAMLVLVLTGFIVLQVALIGGLMNLGISLGLSATIFSVLYFAIAYAVFHKTRRDKRAGPPFAATQRELKESIQWIQKILS